MARRTTSTIWSATCRAMLQRRLFRLALRRTPPSRSSRLAWMPWRRGRRRLCGFDRLQVWTLQPGACHPADHGPARQGGPLDLLQWQRSTDPCCCPRFQRPQRLQASQPPGSAPGASRSRAGAISRRLTVGSIDMKHRCSACRRSSNSPLTSSPWSPPRTCMRPTW